MKHSLDGSFGATKLQSDLRHLKSLEAKIRNLLGQGWQPLECFLHCHLKEYVVHLAVGQGLQGVFGIPGRQSHIAFGGAMVGPLSAHLVQRNHDQDLPEFFAAGSLVEAPLRGMEETSKYRLDDIFRVESLGQLRPAAPFCERLHAADVASMQCRGRVLTPIFEVRNCGLLVAGAAALGASAASSPQVGKHIRYLTKKNAN